jgi:hypothetical protein
MCDAYATALISLATANASPGGCTLCYIHAIYHSVQHASVLINYLHQRDCPSAYVMVSLMLLAATLSCQRATSTRWRSGACESCALTLALSVRHVVAQCSLPASPPPDHPTATVACSKLGCTFSHPSPMKSRSLVASRVACSTARLSTSSLKTTFQSQVREAPARICLGISSLIPNSGRGHGC